MTKRNSKAYILWQKIIKILGIIALIGTFFLAFWLFRLGILNDSNALKDLVQRYRLWGPFVFIVVQIIQIVFPVIPGGLTTVAGFLIFGPVTGFIYNYVGIIIGSIV
ncbi:TPA: TVP38/TMEM64 family protein, partial [Streptococcus pyogenes]|nr:TVP38/TMEM64 family protein [Streptococcus pyogenes]